MRPASAKSFDTSEIRRIFSIRSTSEKPRFLFRPHRILSPSRQYAGKPLLTTYSSKAKLKYQNNIELIVITRLSRATYAMVDLPAPDNPE